VGGGPVPFRPPTPPTFPPLSGPERQAEELDTLAASVPLGRHASDSLALNRGVGRISGPPGRKWPALPGLFPTAPGQRDAGYCIKKAK